MLTLIFILIIIASILLILFILAQNPKGGGLSATFGGSNQIIGARQTADFLEKATWYFAIGILVLVIVTNFFIPSGSGPNSESRVANSASEMSINIATNPEGAPTAGQDAQPARPLDAAETEGEE